MRAYKIENTFYDKFVQIHNTEGKESATKFLENQYNIQLPTFLKRLKNESTYTYNRKLKKFEKKSLDAGFISLDDLCDTKGKSSVDTTQNNVELASNIVDFNNIIVDLMRDRLTEIYKYIKIDPSSKTIIINTKALKENDYLLTV